MEMLQQLLAFAFSMAGTVGCVCILEGAPNHDISMTTLLHAAACAVFGIIGAAFSSLDKKVKGRQMFWHLCLGGVITGLGFCLAAGMWPHTSFLVWLLPSFLIGLCIYGIAVALRKTDRSAEDIDLTEYLKKKANKE